MNSGLTCFKLSPNPYDDELDEFITSKGDKVWKAIRALIKKGVKEFTLKAEPCIASEWDCSIGCDGLKKKMEKKK